MRFHYFLLLPRENSNLLSYDAGNEARVYELVCRHFLACVSDNAVGKETTVSIDINGEKVNYVH